MATARIVSALIVGVLLCGAGAASQPLEEAHEPHTPTLIYYLTDATSSGDENAIRAGVAREKTASVVEINRDRSYVRVKFDSHVVSYHEMAQTLTDAGATLGKRYAPTLLFQVTDYAKHAAEVDAIFAGKRLNTRVHLAAVDKGKGLFAVHFLPLKLDPHATGPQGFNGGHLHHPVSDPDPRGLNLPSSYASIDQVGIYPPAATQPE